MISAQIKSRIDDELSAAEDSRSSGNEAQARVRARRAAGLALQAYYHARGQIVQDASAINLISALQADPYADPAWREIAELLLTRVNKDFSFPSQKDLISETRRLIKLIETALKGTPPEQ